MKRQRAIRSSEQEDAYQRLMERRRSMLVKPPTLASKQPKLQAGYAVLSFERGGVDNQKFVKAVKAVTSDVEEQAALIAAAVAFKAARPWKRGPMEMHARAKRRPQPFIRVGRDKTKFMLPRLVYKPIGFLVERLTKRAKR